MARNAGSFAEKYCAPWSNYMSAAVDPSGASSSESEGSADSDDEPDMRARRGRSRLYVDQREPTVLEVGGGDADAPSTRAARRLLSGG